MIHILKYAIVLLIFTSQAHAQTPSSFAVENSQSVSSEKEYYTIDENELGFTKKRSTEMTFETLPSEFSPESLLAAGKRLIVNLLNWTLHAEPRPTPNEQYSRKVHFGRWINDPTDDTCMNTRAKVLVRESEEQVTFRNERQCVVDSGKWLDRYSNQVYSASRDIQIDHMVPLKHAYMAGAWNWDYKARCLYANYLGYKNHLVPASVRENTSKGDRAPDKYLPSDSSYRCQYIKDWLAIKLIWKLNLTQSESQAIQEVIRLYNCQPSDFQLTSQDLREQRQFINNNLEYCTIHRR